MELFFILKNNTALMDFDKTELCVTEKNTLKQVLKH